MLNLKKTATLITVVGLCLSVTCVGFAGHRKHKEKPSKQTAATTVKAEEKAKAIEADNTVTEDQKGEQEKAKAPENFPKQEMTTKVQEAIPPVVEKLPYVLVDENMGNLQLTDANTPVYDKYTVTERRTNGLNTYMPDLVPYRNGKIAYLTFDDGPDGKNTLGVLDVLKNEGVKGTFYVVGYQCPNYPETLKRIYNEGHAIGNHSYSHDYNVLYPYVDNFLAELSKTENIIKDIIGVRPLIVRAPGGTYGMFTSAYYPALKAAGYVEHDWNVCIDDAVGGYPTAADFVQKVREQTASGISSAIVLMHCGYAKEETVKALPEIIQLLRDRGYSFGVMTPMTPQAW